MRSITTLIEAAISEFGTESKLATAAGVAQASINESKKKNRCGHKLALAIDRATSGKVSKHDLRPDLWPRGDAA
jgi:DNA-binding transcriptional regulator YdaS (Cro superfamily)